MYTYKEILSSCTGAIDKSCHQDSLFVSDFCRQFHAIMQVPAVTTSTSQEHLKTLLPKKLKKLLKRSSKELNYHMKYVTGPFATLVYIIIIIRSY